MVVMSTSTKKVESFYNSIEEDLIKLLKVRKVNGIPEGVDGMSIHDTVAELRRQGKKIIDGSKFRKYINMSMEEHKRRYPDQHSNTKEHKIKYPDFYKVV